MSPFILAVIVGALLSSAFLKIFVHPGAIVNITSKSESWIGAWWLGFAIGSALAFIVGIALTAFPRITRNARYKNEASPKQPMVCGVLARP